MIWEMRVPRGSWCSGGYEGRSKRFFPSTKRVKAVGRDERARSLKTAMTDLVSTVTDRRKVFRAGILWKRFWTVIFVP